MVETLIDEHYCAHCRPYFDTCVECGRLWELFILEKDFFVCPDCVKRRSKTENELNEKKSN